MLDVTDNELTVTVRVPEGRWLWLVSLGAGVSLAEWPSLYTATTYLWVSACVRHLLVRVSPSQVHHGRGSRGSLRTEPPSPSGGQKWKGRLGNRKEEKA